MTLPAQLYQLEQLDTDLQRRETELAELQRRQQRHPELDALEKRLEQLRAEERTAHTELRALERRLDELAATIERTNGLIYGGTVVDPRELDSLERQRAHAEEERNALEDQCLLVMERHETLLDTIAAVSRQVNELRDTWETNLPELAREAEWRRDSLAGMRAERDALAAAIEARALQLYARLRAATGHAVSPVMGGVCGLCRVTLPPRDVQHARAGQLVTCTNCSRILYIG